MTEKDSGTDQLKSWSDRQAGAFADHPLWFVLKCAMFVAFIAVVFAVISWAFGWFDAGKDIAGPANAKTQSANVRSAWQGMLTASQNACQAQQSAKENGDPVIVEDPALAYAATYRSIRSDFNRFQQNPFENGITSYGGYPTRVPIFKEENKSPPDWCSVTNELLELHN